MATMVLRNARLLSGLLADVAIDCGKVVGVGHSGAEASMTSDIDVVDVGGRVVAPGMWDEHVHFTQHVAQRLRIDLSPAKSAAGTVALVRDAFSARNTAMFVGYGFRDGTWPDRPTRAALDGINETVPIVLISGDLHCAWMNTMAARRFGLDLDESGMAREGTWIGVSDRLVELNPPTMADYRDAAMAAAQRGVVGIVEFEHADNVGEWPRRVAAGVDQLRVETSVWPDRLDDVVRDGLRTGEQLDDRGLVTMGKLKVVVDGSLNTRTALCYDPYPDLPIHHPHRCGMAGVSVDQLRDLLRVARDARILAAVHAIGDRANSEVLDVFGQLAITGQIEHAQLIAAGDFRRFSELGIVASVQPEHAMDDRDVADHHWAGRTDRAFAFGSLHQAGATLRLGSDAPVAPLDPWISLAAAVFRSRGASTEWHPEQAVPFHVAYGASTRGRMSVSVGDDADLVVLDQNPAVLDRDRLRAMPVAATMVGGRFTWNGLP